MGKGGLGIKAGDFALRRVEDNVQRLAVGLTLHAGQGQVEIKMLLLQVAQLVLKRLLALYAGIAYFVVSARNSHNFVNRNIDTLCRT